MQISGVSNAYSKVAFGMSKNPTEPLNPEIISQPQAFPATAGAQGLDDEPKKGGFMKTLGKIALTVAAGAAILAGVRKFVLSGDIAQMNKFNKCIATAGEWIISHSKSAWAAVKGLFNKPATPPAPPAA